MIKQILQFVMLLVFLLSCNPAYIPNMSNVPLLSEENELNINIGASTSGFEPQISYAFNDKFGVMCNANFSSSKNDGETDSDRFHQHFFGELGVGRYWANTKNFRFEVFGGFGAGKINSYIPDDEFSFHPIVDAFSTRFFLQPNIGLKTSVFDLALSNRFSFVHMNFTDNNMNSSNIDPYWEPSLIVKLGYHNIKVFSQFGISLPLFEHSLHYNYMPFVFGIGVQLNIVNN